MNRSRTLLPSIMANETIRRNPDLHMLHNLLSNASSSLNKKSCLVYNYHELTTRVDIKAVKSSILLIVIGSIS